MERIGFTMGVYDMIHSGHINLLNKAKSLCDILIVGIVRDKAVKAHKGDDRPMIPLSERITIVKNLQAVDGIILLNDFDPTKELEDSLFFIEKPLDMFIKGEDQDHINHKYAIEKNVPIVYIQRTPNISTTDIIKRKNAK